MRQGRSARRRPSRRAATPRQRPDAPKAEQTPEDELRRALSQHQQLLAALMRGTPDLYAVKRADGVYQAACPRFCAFAQRNEAEIRGQDDPALFPPRLAQVLQLHDARVFASAEAHTWDQPMPPPHGGQIMRFFKSPISAASGRCAGLLCVMRDVTARHRLHRQAGLLRKVPAGAFWVVDMDGTIRDANHAYCTAVGRSRDEVVNRRVQDFELLATTETIASWQSRARQEGFAQAKTFHQTSDGAITEFRMSMTHVDIDGGRFLIFFEEPQPASVAPAAAHAAEAVPPPVQTPSTADTEALRQREVVNFNSELRHALTLLDDLVTRNIEVRLDLASDLANCMAYPPQLLQVFMNLLINAVEAVEGHGTIHISTRNIEVSEALAQGMGQLAPGRHVFAAIRDNGRGIPADLIDKVFDPFITTKLRGRGMGLTSVRRSIAEHRGAIDVRSRVGVGSTFTVYLPASPAPVTRAGEVPSIPTGTDTIVVLSVGERDARPIESALHRLGYRLLRIDAVAGLERVITRQDPPVDLVLVYGLCPGINEAAGLFRAAQPRTKWLAVLPEAANSEQTASMTWADEILAAPFAEDVLALALRRVLDGRNGFRYYTPRVSGT